MRYLPAVLALLLASCASLNESECVRGDWHGIGFRDGAAGRGEAYIREHADACAGLGIQPDVALWRAGREEGLRLYCTPQNAYDAGRRGERLRDVCSHADGAALEAANARGLRYAELGREIARLESERDALNRQIDLLLGGEVTDAERLLIQAYRDDLRRTERTIRLLEGEQLNYARLS